MLLVQTATIAVSTKIKLLVARREADTMKTKDGSDGRNLEDDVKARLQRRARRNGRSTEEEVHEILRNAVRDEGGATKPLGRRLRERFARIGLADELPELRGEVAQPALFGNKKRSGRRSVQGRNRPKT